MKTKGGVRTLSLPFSTPIQNALVHDLTVKVMSPLFVHVLISLTVACLPCLTRLHAALNLPAKRQQYEGVYRLKAFQALAETWKVAALFKGTLTGNSA